MKQSKITSSRPFLIALGTAVAMSLIVVLTSQALEHGLRDPAARHAGAEPGRGTRLSDNESMAESIEPAAWSEIEKLVDEQKLQAAVDRVAVIREAARRIGDDEQLTRALIREVQLRIGLHGYETSVRFLKEQTWPEAPRSRAVLNLFYGSSLHQYAQAYSWEIRQRETISSSTELDLKAWPLERIVEEIHAAYGELWEERCTWGDASIGDLARYIRQSSYPPRVRGTLRDAVTYLWVDLLADTTLWRAEHSNQVYRLDLEALIQGRLPAGDAEGPGADGPDLHPLVLLAGILGDLEAWHIENDRLEAGLEARLERLRRLRIAMPSADDKVAIRQSLETSLASFDRSLEWWSMGQTELAEMLRSEGEADSLALAHEAASSGRRAHPSSIGGRRCKHIVAAIEAPMYQLASMAADGSGRRSLQIKHRNLDRLYLRAYRYDLFSEVEGARDYEILPGHREVPSFLEARKPVARWSEQLPGTPDYQTHQTYSVPPLEEPGAYLIIGSVRKDFALRSNHLLAVNLIITDMVLVTRNLDSGLETTARDGDSGDPVAGVEVRLYRSDWQTGHTMVARTTTGPDGLARLDPGSKRRHRHGSFFIMARRDGMVALDPSQLSRYVDQPRPRAETALVYTDRSVYRPGQTLHWKVVAYSGRPGEGEYTTEPGKRLAVRLVDANGDEVHSEKVRTNSFGSVSGELVIPPGRLLGQWRVLTSIGGAAPVRVEEYKRPTFEVEINEPEKALRLNRPAELVGEARYYFGLPVSTGGVAWRVTREPVMPPWFLWWRRPGPATEPQVVAAGETRLDPEGRLRVSFTPEADEREADNGVTYRFRLAVEVTDEGGETREAERVFRLGFVSVEASLELDRAFLVEGERARLSIVRSDLDGAPRAGQGQWVLSRLIEPEAAALPADLPVDLEPDGPVMLVEGSGADRSSATEHQTPGDRLRPRWAQGYSPEAVLGTWKVGAERANGVVEHSENGRASLELEELDPGAYRVVYTTEDDFGAVFKTERSFVVTPAMGEGPRLAAMLLAESSSIAVGETLRLLVHSGFDSQYMVLETYRDGKRLARRPLQAGEGPLVHEIEIGSEDRGGLGFTLTVVRDHQIIRLEQRVFVPWDDQRLEIELATFRDRLRPGARETFRVLVRGPDQRAVEEGTVELLAYMFDRSLDLFARHAPVDVMSLYPNRAAVGRVEASVGQARIAWSWSRDWVRLPPYPQLTADHLKMLHGYGIGGPGRMMYLGADVGMAKAAPMAAMAEAAGEGLEMAGAAPMDEQQSFSDQALPQLADLDEQEPPAGEEPGVELRSDFAETAFWIPHLLTGADGEAVIELEVPDSVTEWSMWIHALSQDLKAGSLERKARSVKDLMVRPYVPRFLREGDHARLKVVVNNASARQLEGELDLEIRDAETDEDLLEAFGLSAASARAVGFAVDPGAGADLVFPITVPARVGTVAIKVVARADGLSDGELRPVPVLPGRLHLAQSRFVALQDDDRRQMTFDDMRLDDDPSLIHDQLVVTIDAQLLYSVLSALPYLVSYPYECTEQTLNRFLSTGIVSSVFEKHPAIAEMADRLSARDTRLEAWDRDDPNLKMSLEETPWLMLSRGGEAASDDLINVLDPRVAKAERDAALAELEKAQTSLGGFPWWPGGPPSPYMTLYLLYGFSKGLEHEVEVPKQMVVDAWRYMHRHYIDELATRMQRDDCCWELVTFLNLVLSAYPDDSWTGGVFSDDDRRQMLEHGFRHWKQHSPLLKCYLALTLERGGRHDDAMLVLDSVMDSARTTRDEGTFWAPEDRGWLWYNDRIETHAVVLRALTELDRDDARRHGLVHWLLLNKKLNHWRSTRATAEVIYALVHYLENEGALGIREKIRVAVGPRTRELVFEPEQYTGARNRVIIDGPEIEPETMSTVVVSKQSKGLAFASATWHFSTARLPAEARGDLFSVSRSYLRRVSTSDGWTLEPITEGARLELGDQLEVRLSIRARHAAEHVHLRDPRGAGFEPESVRSGYRWDLGLARYEETRDSGASFFFDWLPAGEYTLKYRVRAAMAGRFRVGPAVLQSMYAPEFVAYSSGALLEVSEKEER